MKNPYNELRKLRKLNDSKNDVFTIDTLAMCIFLNINELVDSMLNDSGWINSLNLENSVESLKETIPKFIKNYKVLCFNKFELCVKFTEDCATKRNEILSKEYLAVNSTAKFIFDFDKDYKII